MKILVGLSGGVDSAVAAALLLQQGHEVVGGFMRNWDAMANFDVSGNPTLSEPICPQEQDYNDALAVAKRLGIELLRVDFVAEYWQEVFSVFIEETKLGYTPNPDILCNRHIKFDAFIAFAKKHGFDGVATGHYAQVQQKDGDFVLKKGLDRSKDQTYFLVQIPKTVLPYIHFPLGHLTKVEVRAIAQKLGFDIASKKDSTGICFIGERHFREFLTNYIPKVDGDILDVDSKKVLGKHHGVMFYTIGQRKGLNIGGDRGPWFVVGKNLEKNQLYVGAGSDHPDLLSDQCSIRRVNWLDKPFTGQRHCMAKFRYRQSDHPVTLKWDQDQLIVSYPQQIASVTSGQEAVFYDGEFCLGGGQIDKVFKANHEVAKSIKERMSHD